MCNAPENLSHYHYNASEVNSFCNGEDNGGDKNGNEIKSTWISIIEYSLPTLCIIILCGISLFLYYRLCYNQEGRVFQFIL